MEVEDFPKEIRERIMDCQWEQGNKRDLSVFVKQIMASKLEGGFDWNKAKEGYDFWDDIMSKQNFSVFYKKYPNKDKQIEQDNVNHPSHYTWLKDLCGIEVIDITRYMDFDLGNAIKYILRNGHKSEQGMSNDDKAIEDLRKAIFYINDEINKRLNKQNNK